MLMLYDEFLNKCKEYQLSCLQIALLVNLKVICPSKIKLKNGFCHYLFDDNDLIIVKNIVLTKRNATICGITNTSIQQDYIMSLLDQSPGLSQALSEIILSEIDETSNECHIPDKYVSDIIIASSNKGNKLSNNILKNLLRIRTLFTKISGMEYLQFQACIAISVALLPCKIVKFYFNKVYICDTNCHIDNCLQIFVDNNGRFGWKDLDGEITVIEMFKQQNIDINKLTLEESLSLMKEIENKYETVEKLVAEYRKYIDPDDLIIRLLAYQLLMPHYENLIKSIEAKKQKVNRTIRQGLKALLDKSIDVMT